MDAHIVLFFTVHFISKYDSSTEVRNVKSDSNKFIKMYIKSYQQLFKNFSYGRDEYYHHILWRSDEKSA